MRSRPWLAVPLIGLLVILAGFTLLVVRPATKHLTHGYLAYYVAAQSLRMGVPATKLYDDSWFSEQVRRISDRRTTDVWLVNPPTLAVAWMPLAHWSVWDARTIWLVISFLCALASIWLIATGLSWPQHLYWVIAVMSLFFLLAGPTREQFQLGQMYTFLLLLHSLTWRAYLRRRDAAAGSALGAAMILKLSGWPIGLLMLSQRRWKAVIWALGAAILIALLALPWTGAGAWQVLLVKKIPEWLQGPQSALTAYQDTPSFWQHLFRYDPTWNPHPLLAAPSLASVLTLSTTVAACAALIVSRASESRRFAAAVALTELLSPIAEQYHYTVLLLPIAVLWNEALILRSRRLQVLALIATFLIAAPIHYKLERSAWSVILNYPRLLGGWIAVAGLLRSSGSERLRNTSLESAVALPAAL